MAVIKLLDASFQFGTAWGLFSPPFAKWLCVQTADAHWLADALYPFKILQSILGMDRLKQML